MEKVELFDASTYIVMVDTYLDMADPYIQNHFFDAATAFAIVFLGFFPMLMSMGQLAMAAFLPPIYWGMAVFNVPISLALAAYWGLIGKQIAAAGLLPG